MADKYTGPYAAELALAFEIAEEAGRMITSASAKRWQQTSTTVGAELGTKKNSVDVSLLNLPTCNSAVSSRWYA